MKREIQVGKTDYSVFVFIPDPASTDGGGKTGLVAANLTVSGSRMETDNDATVTDYTGSLNDLAALTSAHNDWGLKEISSTLAPGLYRLDIADAIFASGAWTAVVYVMITTSAAAASPMEFILVAHDPDDRGTAQTGDAYARLGAPAGASVSADVAAVKTDTAAVKTKTDFLPSATAGAAGGVFIAGTNAATTVTTSLTTTFTGNLTGSVASVTGAVGSVTGAVGSVSGNVGGNVAGSVGSVTSRVTANTDQLAGQTVTAAAGVTFPTSVASPTNISAGTITTVSGNVSGNVGGNVTGSVGSIAAGGIAAASFAAGAINAAAIATDAIDADALKADAITEIQSGLATAADVTATGTRRNLTTYSERFDLSPWIMNGCTVVGGQLAPDGSFTAFKIVEDVTGSADHRPYQFFDADSDSIFTLSVHAKAGERSALYLTILNRDSVAFAAFFDLSAGTVGDSEGAPYLSSAIAEIENGYYRCSITGSMGTGGASPYCALELANGTTTGDQVYAGDGTSGAYIWGAQLEVGALTAYDAVPNALYARGVEVAAVRQVTDKLDDTLAPNGSSPLLYQFTADALELAPTGGGTAPTAAENADAVWDALRAAHVGAGSFGEGVASVQGNVTGSVASVSGNVGGNVVGSVASVSGNVGGNVTGSVGSVATGGIAAASFAAGAIDAAAIATDAFGALELAAGAASEIATAVRTELTTELGRIDVATSTRLAPTTAGRTLDVTTTGEAGIDWANIGAPTTTVNLSGTTVKTATDVETDTSDIQSRLPAALVSGRIDASVGAMAANTLTATAIAADAITAAKIATDAIDADALKADAVAEIQSGLSTLNAAGVRTAVGLASANLDTQLAALPTAAENADAAWDELLAGHAISGSAGEALTAAGTGGNPWAAVLEGSYTAQDLLRIVAAGMAGKTTIADTTFGATVVFRDVTDATDIISADMVGSERASVTLAP